MRKLVVFAVVLLTGCASPGRRSEVPAPSRQTTPHIDGEVEITTRTGSLGGRLTYSYLAGDTAEPVIKFSLARAYEITAVTCGVCKSYTFDKQARSLATVAIELSRPLSPRERVDIDLSYHGPLEEAWDSTHAYVELGLDNLWFPVRPNITSQRFTYRMAVRTDLTVAQLFSNGRVQRTGTGWVMESAIPDIDIDLVFSPNVRVTADSTAGYDLRVASVNPTGDDAPALLAHIRRSLDYLNSLLGAGDPLRRVTAVVRPFSVEGQGGYARNGYFVMTKSTNPGDDLHYVAHELSHHWWLQAPQRHAWLNESFAEYTALMAIRSIRGQAAFDSLLAGKRRESTGLPPVYGFDRAVAPRQAPGVFYRKGPVLLGELESEIGDSTFARFLRAVVTAEVRDTDTLIEVLARVTSRGVADEFLQRLKQ